jgi:hypothetical protein
MGVAAKIVPTLNGVDVRLLSSLSAPLLLINTGCLLRVVGQTATDFSPAAFPLTGISGLLEVTALALWGIHLLRIMFGKAPRKGLTLNEDLKTRSIQPLDKVAAVLDDEPRLVETFLLAGFTQLSSDYARQTIARVVTLRQACRRMGVDEQQFIALLNQQRQRLRSLELPLVPTPQADRCSAHKLPVPAYTTMAIR